MLVRELMNPKPVVVAPEMSVPDALSLMRERKVQQMPVLDTHGHLIGIVTEKDLLHASATSVTTLTIWEIPTLLAKIKVETVMVKEKDVVCVAEDTTVEEAARIMADKLFDCLPVMKGEMMVGLITKGDLFIALLELLGGRRLGVRVWVTTASIKGTVAKITSAIAGISGNIVGLGYNEVRDAKGARWEMTIKVQDVSKDKLLEALRPVVVEILDVREG
jgi:acetoin utilization protein AcuB